MKRRTSAQKAASSRRKQGASNGNYANPQLRERLKEKVKRGTKGGKAGQWSARKAQLLAAEYKQAGGRYKQTSRTASQKNLQKWTKEGWTTSDRKPAIRGGGTRRYLPKKTWTKLSPGQKTATNRKKVAGSQRGRQFVSNTRAAARARKGTSKKS